MPIKEGQGGQVVGSGGALELTAPRGEIMSIVIVKPIRKDIGSCRFSFTIPDNIQPNARHREGP